MADLVIPPQYRVRVKQRLRVLAYAEEHGLKPAARHFALSRTTVREWRDRRDAQGPGGSCGCLRTTSPTTRSRST